MARRHNPIIKINKALAEKLFGHYPGRPTFSQRAGRHIGDTVNISHDTGTDMVHFGLILGGVALIFVGLANR